MSFFHHESDEATAYEQVTKAFSKTELSRELVVALESSKTVKRYKKRSAENGQHEKAKKIKTGFAVTFIDRRVKTKSSKLVDRERAKRRAKDKVEEVVTVGAA